MVEFLMISLKMVPPGLRKVRVFENKGYDVIIFVHDVNNSILLPD